MRSLAIVVAFTLLGCGGGKSPAADLASSSSSSSTDGSTITDASSGPVDMTPVTGIACGTTPCAAAAEFCCTSTRGQTGMCGHGNDAANCSGSKFYCDGPEDCQPAQPVCCYTQSVAAAVCQEGACAGTTEAGLTLCQTSSDCNTGQVCCSSQTSPYKLCLNPGCVAP